jgi:hypothetical protein
MLTLQDRAENHLSCADMGHFDGGTGQNWQQGKAQEGL